MEADALITKIQNDFLDVIDTSQAPTSNGLYTRSRILRGIQSACDYLTSKDDWIWRQFTGGISVLDDGTGSFPGEYQSLGKRAFLSRDSDGLEVKFRPLQQVRRLLALNPQGAAGPGVPWIYSMLSQDTGLFYPAPPVGQTVDVTASFNRRCPRISDSDTDSGLLFIPEEFHDTIIYTLAILDLQLVGGDYAGRTMMKRDVEAQIQVARADAHGQPNARKIPRYGRRRR